MGRVKTKQKILVTGGAGFIGSHVVEAYLKDGHRVVVVDNLSTGKRENIPPKAAFYKADVGNRTAMERIFRKERPSIVNHHASQIDVRFSVANPQQDARQNILGGIGLLELSIKYGVKKWIYASTGGALYGEVPMGKAKEGTPIYPVSPYGASKYALEKYLELYAKLYDLKYTILRYANVYGPRQIPKSEAGVVGIFIDTLLKGKKPTIFGTGLQQRDFVYVQDVAQANRAALNKGMGMGINIGSSRATNIVQLLSLLNKELKSGQKPEFTPSRPGEIFRSVLDNRLARRALGWHPTTTLVEGLRKTIQWQRDSSTRRVREGEAPRALPAEGATQAPTKTKKE